MKFECLTSKGTKTTKGYSQTAPTEDRNAVSLLSHEVKSCMELVHKIVIAIVMSSLSGSSVRSKTVPFVIIDFRFL